MKLKYEKKLKSILGYYKDPELETKQQPRCRKLPSLFFLNLAVWMKLMFKLY
jgi:hypothetical protein